MKEFKIYKITNTKNEKIYIGLTSEMLKTRFYKHKTRKNCRLLHEAMKKHGFENFKIELIVSSNDYQLMKNTEMEMIKKYNSIEPFGYNILIGRKSTENVKKAASKFWKEFYSSDQSLKTKENLKKTTAKWANNNKHIISFHSKRNWQENEKYRNICLQNLIKNRNSRKKSVTAIDAKTKKTMIFDSCFDFAKFVKLQPSTIQEHLNKKNKISFTKGYYIHYTEYNFDNFDFQQIKIRADKKKKYLGGPDGHKHNI